MKKAFILPILVVLLILPVYGKLSVNAEVVDDTIYLDEKAHFTLTVTNPDSVSRTFQVYSPNVEWYVQLEPFVSKIEG